MRNIIRIPEELAHELDLLARAEHKRRTPYAVDLLWRDVRRNKQRQALHLSSGSWNSEHLTDNRKHFPMPELQLLPLAGRAG